LATRYYGVNVAAHFRYAPLPQVDGIRGKPRPRHRHRKVAVAPLRYDVRDRSNLTALRQLARQPLGIVTRSVRRDDRDSVAAGQLRDDLEAADSAAGVRRPQAAHLDPEDSHNGHGRYWTRRPA